MTLVKVKSRIVLVCGRSKKLKAYKTMIHGLWHIVVKAADVRPERGQVFG